MAGGAFQIRSKKWDIGVLIGSLALLLVGFGGLFALQTIDSAGNPTLFFIVFLGILTFAGFAGPGIVYVLRKRNAWVKAKLPGGTMAWIRSHLYLPVIALVAAYVHASVVPFRAHLSSGKVLLVLGILVSIAGMCRHHLIGVQKAALNVNVAISKITSGQPRNFRRLVADFTDTPRPVGEIDAEMAQFPPDLQERWAKIKTLRSEVDKFFPRSGGQRINVRSYKLWRALHPPLTILLFIVLGFHVWDVLGGTNPFNNDKKADFVAAQSCAGCHSKEYAEWGSSAMAHAQTSTITVAQLPVTLAHNRLLADQGQVAANNQNPDKVINQDDLFKATAKVCITCHSPVGARFAPNTDSLYPLGDDNSAGVKAKGAAVSGGGSGVQTDGVGCEACHGTSKPPVELQAAFGPLNDQKSSLGGFGTVFAPLFENPNPLPQRIHDIGQGDGNFWNDPIKVSQVCGACHNVKVDLQGDGLANDPNANPADPNAAQTTFNGDDVSAVPITDPATAADHDQNKNLQLDENEVDATKDVVLQTTYDEWQDYVAFFDAPGGFKDRYSSSNLTDFSNPLDSPLGCSDCHMPLPSKDNPTTGVVDHAPGLLSIPNREYHTHIFVGVDYDLNPARYQEAGLPSNALDKVLAEREALVRSAVALQVEAKDGAGNPSALFATHESAGARHAERQDRQARHVHRRRAQQPARPHLPHRVRVRSPVLARGLGHDEGRQAGLPVCAVRRHEGRVAGGNAVCVRRAGGRDQHEPRGHDQEGEGRADSKRRRARPASMRSHDRGKGARARPRGDAEERQGQWRRHRYGVGHHAPEPQRQLQQAVPGRTTAIRGCPTSRRS